ncbi:MAG: hydroxyethylthiazole kinase [Aestuariivita sp.]|nr:hydroxyethylthiazole kinase [Aestuariivita sp.]
MAFQTLLRELRLQNPVIQCITNYVAMNISANVVLAAGASPAMVHAEEEIADFTPLSNGLSINVGTLSSPWIISMKKAAAMANEKKIPWVLDPVAHFISSYRAQATKDLLNLRPVILRGNASEILTLAGKAGAGKGADAGDSVEDAQEAGRFLAAQFGTVVAISGLIDFVTDGSREARVEGGSSIMPQVTALGCAQSALMGAYAAVGPAFEAALSALAHFKVSGTVADGTASGPGSFQVGFLDALATTQPDQLQDVIL